MLRTRGLKRGSTIPGSSIVTNALKECVETADVQ